MAKVRAAAFSISLDGFGAGARQDLNNPLGVRGMELHWWFMNTEAFKRCTAKAAEPKASITTSGLFPSKTSVPGSSVAICSAQSGVLGKTTHGKTSESAAASPSIRQYLAADQIDEMHIAVSPLLLGEGEPDRNPSIISLGLRIAP
jgi:hypothetical protein